MQSSQIRKCMEAKIFPPCLYFHTSTSSISLVVFSHLTSSNLSQVLQCLFHIIHTKLPHKLCQFCCRPPAAAEDSHIQTVLDFILNLKKENLIFTHTCKYKLNAHGGGWSVSFHQLSFLTFSIKPRQWRSAHSVNRYSLPCSLKSVFFFWERLASLMTFICFQNDWAKARKMKTQTWVHFALSQQC